MFNSRPLDDFQNDTRQNRSASAVGNENKNNPQNQFNMSFTNYKLPLIKTLHNKSFHMNYRNISLNCQIVDKVPDKIKDYSF